MKALCLSASALLIAVAVQVIPDTVYAQDSECAQGKLIEQSFRSGAAWSLCASVDEAQALHVSSVSYRAPGDSLRSVMQAMHIGQILMQYHDESTPRAQIGSSDNGRLLDMTSLNCSGETLLEDENGAKLCSHVRDNRTQAKFAQRPSVQSKRWELSSALQRDSLVWEISISFHEDGRIIPGVTLSGQARSAQTPDAFSARLPDNGTQLIRASIVTTWRMVFGLDSNAFDTVQQFDFPLAPDNGNRRAMQVRDLETESFHSVKRRNFRGWRVVDTSGASYYLDPFNSGFGSTGMPYDWAQHDLALTRFNPCEMYAQGNAGRTDVSSGCADSLDDFVNDEPLLNAHPTLWFSQIRTLNPSDEDWPVISNFHQSFTLLPYDWTSASPFEITQ